MPHCSTTDCPTRNDDGTTDSVVGAHDGLCQSCRRGRILSALEDLAQVCVDVDDTVVAVLDGAIKAIDQGPYALKARDLPSQKSLDLRRAEQMANFMDRAFGVRS